MAGLPKELAEITPFLDRINEKLGSRAALEALKDAKMSAMLEVLNNHSIASEEWDSKVKFHLKEWVNVHIDGLLPTVLGNWPTQ